MSPGIDEVRERAAREQRHVALPMHAPVGRGREDDPAREGPEAEQREERQADLAGQAELRPRDGSARRACGRHVGAHARLPQ